MIAFEVIFLFAASIVAIVTIAAIGRPLAEAHAEKMKAEHRAITPGAELKLQLRVTALEEEVRELKRQMASVEESADFAAKMADGDSLKGEKVNTVNLKEAIQQKIKDAQK